VLVPQRERIVHAVAALLQDAGVQRAPVDLFAVANARGVTDVEFVSGSEMKGLLGHVSSRQEGLRIRINADTPLRQRFTFAHEIAHTLVSPELGGDRSPVGTPSGYRATERLCDRIASEILMPTAWFEASSKDRPVSIDTMVELAEEFEASVESVAVRMSRQRGQYVELICWRPSDDETQLHAKWVAGFPKLSKGSTRGGFDVPLTEAFGPARALTHEGSVFSRETSSRSEQFLVESRKFGNSDYRYVLSVVKPFLTQSELVGAQIAADARARRQTTMRSQAG
jgi:Zn-dependent peptidase ImmA (M78 family)